MKYIFIIFFIFFIFIYKINSFDFKKLYPENIVEINFSAGIGFYLGNFRDHLKKVGSYTETVLFDIYISLFIIKYFGIQSLISNSYVIHPRSYPIEGTTIYLACELFGYYEVKLFYFKIFTGAGFQNCTMLISYYSSGFFEAGAELGIKINKWIAINNMFKYRMGFLHSLLVYPDNFMSFIISTGITFKIKNPYL